LKKNKLAGFVAGERIIFDVSIDNKSGSEINVLELSLVQTVRFIARGKSRISSSIYGKINLPGKVPPKSNQTFDNQVFSIPAVCSSSNDTCHIIRVSYLLNFKFGKSGLSMNQEMNIPITIGTIPLASQNAVPAPSFSFETDLNTNNSDPPPSYSEAGDNKNQFGVPVTNLSYPFYKDYTPV
jgi:hypothetical protein